MKTQALGLFPTVYIAINTATTTSSFKVFIFTVHIIFKNDNDNDNDDDDDDDDDDRFPKIQFPFFEALKLY